MKTAEVWVVFENCRGVVVFERREIKLKQVQGLPKTGRSLQKTCQRPPKQADMRFFSLFGPVTVVGWSEYFVLSWKSVVNWRTSDIDGQTEVLNRRTLNFFWNFRQSARNWHIIYLHSVQRCTVCQESPLASWHRNTKSPIPECL